MARANRLAGFAARSQMGTQPCETCGGPNWQRTVCGLPGRLTNEHPSTATFLPHVLTAGLQDGLAVPPQGTVNPSYINLRS